MKKLICPDHHSHTQFLEFLTMKRKVSQDLETYGSWDNADPDGDTWYMCVECGKIVDIEEVE